MYYKEENDTYYLIHHYYDGDDNGTAHMQIRELAWAEDGWPVAREKE
ncbi:hypothetical protein [Salibacterium aidingense]